MSLDFGYGGDSSSDKTVTPSASGDASQINDLGGGNTSTDANGNPITDINAANANDVNVDKAKGKEFDNGDENKDKDKDLDPNKPKDETAEEKGGDSLVAGSVIEIGDDKYTVSETGTILDKDGNVFKEAAEVKDWLASFDRVDDDSDVISISTIQDVIGIDIVGDDGQPIVFDNTPIGIKAYVDAVNDAARDEHYEEAVNTLYQKYPFLPDALNYYVANGNSMEGFGEVQDRSTITIDEADVSQQESIIRAAWVEQNRKGDVDAYIQYLKSSNTLLPVSQEELAGLQDADKEHKDQIAKEAKEEEEKRIAKQDAYWGKVKSTIDSKKIAGYEIPDTIIITKDGKKTAATPNDFYNYIYQIDKDGRSAYQKELAKEDPDARSEDELLRAYLKFVGGKYSSLVNMAINKDKVETLKFASKARSANAIKIVKPTVVPAKGKDIDLGFG